MMSNTHRRWLSSAVAAGAATALLAGCSGGPSPSASGDGEPITITYVSYGGTGQAAQINAWQQPWSALHPNVTFINSSPPDAAQVKAQVEAGAVSWNTVSTAPYLATQNCGTLYEKLDLKGIDPAQMPEGAVGECYIGDFRYSLIFSYNEKSYPDPSKAPKKLADFFDTTNFPGKRGLVGNIQDGFLELGLIADGVSPDALYPLDIERSLAKWDTVRDSTTFAANPGALFDLVTSDQLDMQLLVQARSTAVLDSGHKLVPVWDVTTWAFNGQAIPKGSANKEAIEEFYSYLLQPEPSALFAELSGAGATNLQAKPELTPNGKIVNAFDPANNTGTLVAVNPEYWSTHFNEVAARFTQWLNG